MKKKITIILSVIIVIGILVTLIFAMKKSNINILKSEKSYLEMLVRNQKLDKVDKILKRTKTKETRYQSIEKAYKNYYLDYINNIKDIQTEISKATTKYFINFNVISKGKEAQEGLKVIIEREINIVDKITDIYKKLNEKEEMLKYAKQQGLSEEDEKLYYQMVGGDNEIKEDDIVVKKLGSTKENFKMQENLIKYLIEESGKYTINQVNKTIEFKDEEKKATYKNLITAIDYNINEIMLNNKAISRVLDNLKKTQNVITENKNK